MEGMETPTRRVSDIMSKSVGLYTLEQALKQAMTPRDTPSSSLGTPIVQSEQNTDRAMPKRAPVSARFVAKKLKKDLDAKMDEL